MSANACLPGGRPGSASVAWQQTVGDLGLRSNSAEAGDYRVLAVQSPFGLALASIRENRLRAGALGIATSRRIVAIYTVSAAYAGVAGALLAETTQIASLDLFDFHRSADVLLMLIIGGAGNLYGGLIGAAVFIVLRDVISAATPEYWEFWIGALLVAFVLTGRERIRDVAVRAGSLAVFKQVRGDAA